MNPTKIKNIILGLLQELRNDKYLTKKELLEIWDLLNIYCRLIPCAKEEEFETIIKNNEKIYNERSWK